MAGFWQQSQAQLYNANGKPLIGAKAYFYLGGTTTPITTYSAYALGAVNAQPNPVQTDGFGRWPSVFMDEADGFYRVRVTTAQGSVLYDIDGLPIIGPAGGGGGGGDNPVDPNAVLSTGDMKERYGTGVLAGFVRANGRTIGSATSGASERANSDTQPLFEHLWNADPNLVVLGGRGVSSAADWAANKQITLPDRRGRTSVGLDTMGNTAAGIIPDADDLGWTGGEREHVLTATEMPAHTHTGTTNVVPDHTHPIGINDNTNAGLNGIRAGTTGPTSASATSPAGSHGHTLTTNSAGGGLAHNNLQPSMAVTIYIRL